MLFDFFVISVFDVASILLVASTAVGQEANAPGQSSSWEQLHPGASQHTAVLGLERPEILEHLQVSAGLFAHFVDDPAQLLSEDGRQIESTIIDDQLKTEFGAAIGLFDTLQLNVAVPVVPYQSGEGLTAVDGVNREAVRSTRAEQ